VLARTGTAAPPRPAAAGAPGRWQPRGGRGWRVIAPVAVALAVAGVATGVTLAARSLAPVPRSATGALTTTDKGMPRLYVTLSSPGTSGRVIAEVHSSQTGQILGQTQAGFAGNGVGVSADAPDRAFVIDAAASLYGAHDAIDLYLLRVSASGRSTTLSRLPLVLLPPGSPDVVDGIAVSPNGAKLAVALQVNRDPSGANPRGEIVVYSLHGGATQTWTAPSDQAAPPRCW
jgi:hypothetical protein